MPSPKVKIAKNTTQEYFQNALDPQRQITCMAYGCPWTEDDKPITDSLFWDWATENPKEFNEARWEDRI